MQKTRFIIRGRQNFHAHETARYDELNGLPLAGFWRRFVAFSFDSVLIAVVQLPLTLLYGYVFQRGEMLQFKHASFRFDMPESHVVQLAVTVLYFGLLLHWGKGRTPGKRLMKLRVLSLTHHEIGLWQSIERALGYGASALEGGFGFIQYWINRNRQTVHDRIAETIVVDERGLASK